MKVDILAIGVHPDDVELSCGATIAKFIAQGKTVAILDLTQGELGTRGSAEIRAQEAQQAAKVLGVSARENVFMEDGFFENNTINKLKIIQKIRKYQPLLVFCNALEDRHPDHARAAQLSSEACFLSGLLKIKTEDENGKPQKEWRPKNVLHYIQWKDLTPDFAIDVTGFETQKLNALMAYQSQFYDPNSKEKETPITSKNFLESITYRMQNLGRLAGVDFAEGFNSSKLMTIDNFEELL